MTKRRLGRVAATAVIAALGGCAVGPNYRAAKPVEGAEASLVSASPAAATVAEPPDDWWELYHDEKLNKSIYSVGSSGP